MENNSWFYFLIGLIAAIFVSAVLVATAVVLGYIRFGGAMSGIPEYDPDTVSVVVIGVPSNGTETMLKSQSTRNAGINYLGERSAANMTWRTFSGFDVAILQGVKFCDGMQREEIANFVKGGGKLVVVQDACTKTSDDKTAVGWDVGANLMGSIMPVTIGGVTREYEPVRRTSSIGKFELITIAHPIFPPGQKSFKFSGSVVKVIPNTKANSKVLAYINTSSQQVTDPAVFAIVESKSLMAGKVMYFAFDPGNLEQSSRNMFLNTLLYLKGARG